MTASIVGWAHTPFGKFDAETVESLVVRAATEALADAGITAAEVDEIVLGHFNAGFSPQDFTASLVLQADPQLRSDMIMSMAEPGKYRATRAPHVPNAGPEMQAWEKFDVDGNKKCGMDI